MKRRGSEKMGILFHSTLHQQSQATRCTAIWCFSDKMAADGPNDVMDIDSSSSESDEYDSDLDYIDNLSDSHESDLSDFHDSDMEAMNDDEVDSDNEELGGGHNNNHDIPKIQRLRNSNQTSSNLRKPVDVYTWCIITTLPHPSGIPIQFSKTFWPKTRLPLHQDAHWHMTV